MLQTGAARRLLPDKYPSPAACWLRLKQRDEYDDCLNASLYGLAKLLRVLGDEEF